MPLKIETGKLSVMSSNICNNIQMQYSTWGKFVSTGNSTNQSAVNWFNFEDSIKKHSGASTKSFVPVKDGCKMVPNINLVWQKRNLSVVWQSLSVIKTNDTTLIVVDLRKFELHIR